MDLINNYLKIKNKYKITDTQYLMYLYIQNKINKNSFKISNKELSNIFNISITQICRLIKDLSDKQLIFIYNPSTNSRLIFLSKEQLENHIKNN